MVFLVWQWIHTFAQYTYVLLCSVCIRLLYSTLQPYLIQCTNCTYKCIVDRSSSLHYYSSIPDQQQRYYVEQGFPKKCNEKVGQFWVTKTNLIILQDSGGRNFKRDKQLYSHKYFQGCCKWKRTWQQFQFYNSSTFLFSKENEFYFAAINKKLFEEFEVKFICNHKIAKGAFWVHLLYTSWW